MSQTTTMLSDLRKTTISEIREIIEPNLIDSIYKTVIDRTQNQFEPGNSRRLKIWVNENSHGDMAELYLGGFVIDRFEGISEDGVVLNFGRTANSLGYDAIPIEDLIALKTLVENVINHKLTQKPCAPTP